jgi:hypothetical protein
MWEMAKTVGYTPITTFWEDFSIAEKFGKQAIQDTAERAFNEWHTNVKFLAELIMVLNHKSWFWYENGIEEISVIYSDLYYKYNDLGWDWLETHGTEEEKHWYFETLD